MRRKVVIAADVEESFIRLISQDERFELVRTPTVTEEELLAAAEQAEVLVTRSYNRVSARVIAAARRLQVIAQGTSGTDNIDLEAAASKGVAVLSLPGENANAVAELVIGMMLSLTRTVPFYTREVSGGRWHRSDCSTRHELRHFRLGIVGLGEVGMRVARLARPFGMSVSAFDPYLSDGQFAERSADRVDTLDELLRSCAILSLHVPLTGETRGMIGARELALLPEGSYVINTARGEVLDRTAALLALASNHLAGLALDVYDPEPPREPWPNDPRLILTPHIGGCTWECRTSIGEKLYGKISEYFSDQ